MLHVCDCVLNYAVNITFCAILINVKERAGNASAVRLSRATAETAKTLGQWSPGSQGAVLHALKSKEETREAMLAFTAEIADTQVYAEIGERLVSKSDLALAKERRGARSIKLKNLKMVWQVFYDKDSKKVGARFFRCVCSKCMERKFSECVAKAWTLGEPVWQ